MLRVADVLAGSGRIFDGLWHVSGAIQRFFPMIQPKNPPFWKTQQGSASSSPSVVWEEYDDDAYDGDCLSFDAEGEEDCGTDMGYADDEDYGE